MDHHYTQNDQRIVQGLRPLPTPEDMAAGEMGGGGYTDHSFEQSVKDYGDWHVERVRVGRRPLGNKYLGEVLPGNPVVQAFSKHLLGFETSKAQDHKVHHLYTELLLRNPETGMRDLIKIEKGPRVHTTRGQPGGLETVKHEGRAIDMHAVTRGTPLTFREYAGRTLENHASSRGGDFRAIGRYNIAGLNCQDFTLAGLRGNGFLSPDLEAFSYEPNVEKLPKFIQNSINKFMTG